MSLVYRLLPCGIYVTAYERTEGEYAHLVRRADERHTAKTTQPTTPDTMTLATLIQQGLTAAEMTIAELADELGVTHASANTWIRNTSPNNQNLRRICATLNLDYIAARRLSGRDPGASSPSRTWNQGVGAR